MLLRIFRKSYGLIDGPKLVDLMHQNNVGIQIKSNYEVKELDEDFFEG